MKYLNSFLIFLSLFFWVGSGKAEIKLPAIFDDHMVLQQETEAPIWGMAAEGKKVTLMTSWDKKSYTAKADDEGHWKIKVSTPQAGGPYEISISDGKELILKDILIGEVWVCSGQSNMQMPMKGYFNQPILGSNEAVATSANPRIRLFTVERDKSLTTKSRLHSHYQNHIQFIQKRFHYLH